MSVLASQRADAPLLYSSHRTPIGELLLVAASDGVVEIVFEGSPRVDVITARATEDDRVLESVGEQLDQYFAGERREFDLPLAPRGTPFQLSVWQALIAVDYGETASYGKIAAAIGRPLASRAVGQANNRNPIPIIVPCHRIIGSNGSLTGYAGGLDIKRQLLDLELSALANGSSHVRP